MVGEQQHPKLRVESIETERDKRLFVAGVVRKDMNGAGFAFRGLSDNDSKWIVNRLTNT